MADAYPAGGAGEALFGLLGARLDGANAVFLALEDAGRPLMDEDREPGQNRLR